MRQQKLKNEKFNKLKIDNLKKTTIQGSEQMAVANID